MVLERLTNSFDLVDYLCDDEEALLRRLEEYDRIVFEIINDDDEMVDSDDDEKGRGGSIPGKKPNKKRDWIRRHERLM